MRDHETGGRSRSSSLTMVSFDRLYKNFYWSGIQCIGPCCTIFQVFDVH